jgi:hypothetical protein
MSVWRRWVAFIATRETGEILALFRILTGLGLLWNIGGSVKVVPLIWFDRAYGGYRSLPDAPSPELVWTLVIVSLLAGGFLVIGLGGRITALIAAQSLLALSMINAQTKGSYDALLGNALWLLVLADSTATWSLDARIRGSWTSDRRVSAFPRYLAILQLVVVYFFNGVQKVSAHWTFAGGWSALYYILQQPTWQRFDMTWTAHVYPLTQLGTLVTHLFELGSPLLLLGYYLLRKRRRLDLRIPFVAVGILLHLGIFILLEVGPFSLIILAYYPCLFSPWPKRPVPRYEGMGCVGGGSAFLQSVLHASRSIVRMARWSSSSCTCAPRSIRSE